jgi:hypothetical protein
MSEYPIDWRVVAIRWVGGLLMTLLLLGILVRGPQRTLDWILARADQLIERIK